MPVRYREAPGGEPDDIHCPQALQLIARGTAFPADVHAEARGEGNRCHSAGGGRILDDADAGGIADHGRLRGERRGEEGKEESGG